MASFELRTVRSVAAIAMFMVAGKAAAQMERVQPTLGNADKSQLVIGDGYVVRIEQGKVRRDETGTLLKVTDDWLVLGKRAFVAETTAIPWLGELPYVGALFRTVKQREEAGVYWIPRANATIESRTTSEATADLSVFKIDELKLESCDQISAVRDNEYTSFRATDGIAIRDGAVHFTIVMHHKAALQRNFRKIFRLAMCWTPVKWFKHKIQELRTRVAARGVDLQHAAGVVRD